MDSLCFTNYKKNTLIVISTILLTATSCGVAKQEQAETGLALQQQYTSDYYRRLNNSRDPVNLKFQNNGSTLEYSVGKGNDDFILDIKGKGLNVKNDENASVISFSAYEQQQLNQAFKNFRKAQERLYLNDLEGALMFVDSSINVINTSEALSLKGTILYLSGDLRSAQELWNLALRMDPDIKLPDVKK